MVYYPPQKLKSVLWVLLSIRVLIIRSSERGSFCSGADLVERRTMSAAAVSDFLSDLRLAFSALEDFRMPTIAAIDGPALGGGLELALACDFRIAGRDVTKIGLPETKLGIIPGAGGTQRAARLLGITKAKELIFTGRMLTASEALTYGAMILPLFRGAYG
jgi:methylglutaconyl-CoA hydratase